MRVSDIADPDITKIIILAMISEESKLLSMQLSGEGMCHVGPPLQPPPAWPSQRAPSNSPTKVAKD
jgi:hypothetical protein